MKKVAAILVILAVAGGALWLGQGLATGTTSGGCPTALLQGTLVEVDGTLGVESIPPGTISRVDWPFGYGVGEENGTLVLTRVFATVAREGDQVSMGGGWFGDETEFSACGPVTLGLIAPIEEIPSEPARATLTVKATAYEPCIPPPSGCGYWVSLTSEAFGTDRAPLTHRRSYESAANGTREPLGLGEGLSPWIDPGEYDLAFEVGAFSDAATPVPLDDGTMGYPPELSVACTKRLVVPAGATAVTVDVTYHGSTCQVVVGF
ncbi:MAG TPA: hypothetical protein VES19_07155 [Candidatus Limnocylindrales bacterium]|nr:hypothetical protein [Candidatus Limnocylindrales bacterium]